MGLTASLSLLLKGVGIVMVAPPSFSVKNVLRCYLTGMIDDQTRNGYGGGALFLGLLAVQLTALLTHARFEPTQKHSVDRSQAPRALCARGLRHSVKRQGRIRGSPIGGKMRIAPGARIGVKESETT